MIRKLLTLILLASVCGSVFAGKVVDVIFPNPLNSNAYDGLIKIEVDAGTGEIRFIDLVYNKTLADLATAGLVPLAVKDFHLDVGTGVDQISLDDIPAGITVPVFSEDNTMVYVGPNFLDSASIDFTYTPGSPGTVSADLIPSGFGTSLATPNTLALRDGLGGFSVTAIRAPVVSSLTNVEIQLDEDNNGSNTFTIKNSAGTVVATFDENGFLSVLNTTVVTNLNADLLDGQTGAYYLSTANLTGVLPVISGGTGQTSGIDAFNSFSPLTTQGDILTHNGTNNIRLGVGTVGQVLRSDGSNTAWATLTPSDLSGVIPIANGGTGQTTQTTAFNALDPLTTQGDLITHNGTDSIRLAVGTSGQYMRSNGTDPAWAALTASDLTGTVAVANGGTGQTTQTAAFDALDPLTTKGDLIVFNATNSVRQAVGTDGQILAADSTQTTGIKWRDPVAVTEATSTVTATTTSATFVLIASMQVTPATTGTYLVLFSGSGSVSTNGADVDYSIHNNAVEVAHSRRHLDYNGGGQTANYRSAWHSAAVLSVTGGQSVDVRFRTSAGTLSVYERTLEVIRIN